jgi:hypothetical protein
MATIGAHERVDLDDNRGSSQRAALVPQWAARTYRRQQDGNARGHLASASAFEEAGDQLLRTMLEAAEHMDCYIAQYIEALVSLLRRGATPSEIAELTMLKPRALDMLRFRAGLQAAAIGLPATGSALQDYLSDIRQRTSQRGAYPRSPEMEAVQGEASQQGRRTRHRGHPNRSPEDLLPIHEYVLPLLQTLLDMGGTAQTGRLYERVFQVIQGKLKPQDFEYYTAPRFIITWRSRIRIAHYIVGKAGWASSPLKGQWEITPEGEALLVDYRRDPEGTQQRIREAVRLANKSRG